jgi:hypothetical protein
MRPHRPPELVLPAALALLLAAARTDGAAPGYEITVGVGESDNIQRTPSAAQNETIGTAGLAFTRHDKRRRLDALAAITPANRENVNYVSTGPDLTNRCTAPG